MRTFVNSSRVAQGFNGAVVGEDSRCSKIGMDIMAEMGGNAVDATVAVVLCVGVVNLVSSGIGSVAFLLFLRANATNPLVFHFCEVALGAASKDADSSKDALDNLIAFNATNKRAKKIQLKNELNTIKKGDLSANDYTLKIKALCESLSSIGAAVDDVDKVEACLRGLGNAYKQFKTNIRTQKNIPHF
ncbi:hypothetical protein L7F22_002090 [Adiantum nelumboides]|nr:hypothetical protein [Adiantum nelumboides]